MVKTYHWDHDWETISVGRHVINAYVEGGVPKEFATAITMLELKTILYTEYK